MEETATICELCGMKQLPQSACDNGAYEKIINGHKYLMTCSNAMRAVNKQQQSVLQGEIDKHFPFPATRYGRASWPDANNPQEQINRQEWRVIYNWLLVWQESSG